MESLSVDVGRLKSGEVNLGVRCFQCPAEDGETDWEFVCYLDIHYGRPIQGRGHHWC